MRALFIGSSSLILFLTIFFAIELIGQTTTSGGVVGVITDQSSAVVAGVDVELKDNSKGTSQSTKTDREGVYRFFFLAPSKYVLIVRHEGLKAVRQFPAAAPDQSGKPHPAAGCGPLARIPQRDGTIPQSAPTVQESHGTY